MTYLSVVTMSLAATIGCTQGTPGGPGTSDATSPKPVYGQVDDTFNLIVPFRSSLVQQGETAEATIGIKRAKNFDDDVSLTFADVPQGVTVEPADVMIKHRDKDAKITFHAVNEAAIGDFKVKIVGHPSTGSDAKVEFKLTVSPKDSFTLKMPRPWATLKQGETKTVSIGINRDRTFDQDVALEFGKMPTGVTFEPGTPVIKRGDTEAQIKLASADDASLGEFMIKLTGRPATGSKAENEFKLFVVKQ